MKRIVLGLLAALWAADATAQPTPFPQTLPANTVVGRLGIGPGPAQAIPFSTFYSNILDSLCTTTGALPVRSSIGWQCSSATNLVWLAATQRMGIGTTTPGQHFTLTYPSAVDDVATALIQRTANHVGGTNHFVNSTLKLNDTVSPGNTNFEWTLSATMDNSSTTADGSENVAAYFQTLKRANGGTWGIVEDYNDFLANPTASSVPFELGGAFNGTDTNGFRVLQDIIFGPGSGGAGYSPSTVTYGIRFGGSAASAANAILTNAIYFQKATYDTLLKTKSDIVLANGIDISASAISGNAFKSPNFNVDGVGVVTGAQFLTNGFVVSPTVIGGVAASSTLTIESTSGVGTTDAIIFQTGSQLQRIRISSGGGVTIGASTALTAVTGELAFTKITASGSAPGAAGGKMELVCGTNSGTAKLIVYAGTSTTPVTITDNIGAAVTGC